MDREQRRERWFRVTNDSGLSHSKASIHSLSLGTERSESFYCPLLHQERVGGGMRTDLHMQTHTEVLKKQNLDRHTTTGCSYFSSVFTFLGPGFVNAVDDGIQRVR